MYSYSTRGNLYNYYVPKVNTISMKSFYYNGIVDWNSLSNTLKCIETKDNFKYAVKHYLKVTTSYFD